jgi:hypothetical protein
LTDSEGRYSLTVWHLGDFGVFATHPDGHKMMDHLDLRAVEFGSTVERDFVFSTAKLEGTVVSKEDGSPIPLAKITLKIDLAEGDRRVTRGTRTDGEGRFSFDRVEEAASAVLVAKKDGYAAKSSEPAILADEITTVWIEPEKVRLLRGLCVVHRARESRALT